MLTSRPSRFIGDLSGGWVSPAVEGLGNSTLTKNWLLLDAFLTSARKFYALRIILLLYDDVRRFPCDDNLLVCWHDENLRPAIGCGDFTFAGVTLIPS